MEESLMDWKEDIWKIWDAYFAQSDEVLAQHQLDSYNDFVKRVIPMILELNSPVTAESKATGERTRYELHFKNVYMAKPLMQKNAEAVRILLPSEARERNFSYVGTLFVDLEYKIWKVSDKPGIEDVLSYCYTDTQVPLARIPVMLHSDFCHLADNSHQSMRELGESQTDIGGYFIVSGTSGAAEKVIISQERMTDNCVFAFKPSHKYSATAEIKSTVDQRFHVVRNITVKLDKEGTGKNANIPRYIRVGVPFFKMELPLAIVMMALGVTNHQDMVAMILNGLDDPDMQMLDLLTPSLMITRVPHYPKSRTKKDEEGEEGEKSEKEDKSAGGAILDQLQALEYLSLFYNYREPPEKEGDEKRTSEEVRQVKLELTRNALDKDFLAHMGIDDRGKAFFLAYMVRRMLEAYLGYRQYDDRDHASNKRVDVSGDLMGILFRNNIQKLIKDIRRHLGKTALKAETRKEDYFGYDQSIRGVIQNASIESKLKYGLSTGNWGSGKQTPTSASRKGISQELKRLSLIDMLSHLRRIQTPLERAGSKLIPPRRLHGTYVGPCCLNETPEGAQVVVVKNLALLTLITIKTSSTPVVIALRELGMISMEQSQPSDYRTGIRVMVNGQL